VLIILLGLAGEGWAQRAPAAASPVGVDLVPEFGKLGLAPLAQGNRGDCSLFAITAVPLGAIDLPAGRHALRFTSVGKHPASANVCFGVDAIELDAAE